MQKKECEHTPISGVHSHSLSHCQSRSKWNLVWVGGWRCIVVVNSSVTWEENRPYRPDLGCFGCTPVRKIQHNLRKTTWFQRNLRKPLLCLPPVVGLVFRLIPEKGEHNSWNSNQAPADNVYCVRSNEQNLCGVITNKANRLEFFSSYTGFPFDSQVMLEFTQ